MLIAVCDDNKEDRMQTCSMLEASLRNQQIDGKVLAYDGANQLLSALEHKNPGFDILFLDICMEDMDGMRCARLIRQQDELVKIVFLTSSTDYVYAGYEVNASGYLVKPVAGQTLASLLEKTVRQLADAAKKTIALTSGGVVKRIPFQKILYLESKKNKVEVVLASTGENVAVYTTLDAFEQLHPSALWIRPHKSYLVNFQHVEQFDGSQFTLTNGAVIPVSRAYKEKAKEAFFALLYN